MARGVVTVGQDQDRAGCRGCGRYGNKSWWGRGHSWAWFLTRVWLQWDMVTMGLVIVGLRSPWAVAMVGVGPRWAWLMMGVVMVGYDLWV